MPDRIVRSGILTSDAVNQLTWAGETFYRRLMSVVDDYGRYDGRPSILRATLYPLKLDRVSDRDIVTWIGECQEAGLITIYAVNDKNYIEIKKFDQRLRAKRSKWPSPDGTCQRMTTNAADTDTESETDTEKEVPEKFSVFDMNTATHFFSLIQALNPKHREPNFRKWANEIRLMREQDERSEDEIVGLFEWANSDNFWKTNILSPGKLREKWDTLTIQKTSRNNHAPHQRTDNSAIARVRAANGIKR